MFKFVLTRAFFSPKAVILFFSGFVSQFNLLLANQISAYVRGNWNRPEAVIFSADQNFCSLWERECIRKRNVLSQVF